MFLKPVVRTSLLVDAGNDVLLLDVFAAADIIDRPPGAFYDVVVGNLQTGAWSGNNNGRMLAYTDPTSSPRLR